MGLHCGQLPVLPSVALGANDVTFISVGELTMYHSRWAIRARVTSKTDVRTFSYSMGGGGKVFNVDLVDKEGAEIRACFFNQAVDLYFDKLSVGKVFTFSRGRVKSANPKYTPLGNKFELIFGEQGVVEDAGEGEEIEVKLNLVGISSLSLKASCRSDICGVVIAFGLVHDFYSRAGKCLRRRRITVADDTRTSIDVTLWGRHLQIEDARFEGNPIVVLKGVVLSEWNGRLLGSLGDSGILQFSPELREAKKVQRWWAQGGSGAAIASLVCGTRSHMSIKTLREVACHELGDRAEVFTTYAWVRMVRLCNRASRSTPFVSPSGASLLILAIAFGLPPSMTLRGKCWA